MEDALREETQFWLVTPKSLAGRFRQMRGRRRLHRYDARVVSPEGHHFVATDTQPKYRLSNGDLMISSSMRRISVRLTGGFTGLFP